MRHDSTRVCSRTGQTGSGKTYTMGTSGAGDGWPGAVVPQAARHVFRRKAELQCSCPGTEVLMLCSLDSQHSALTAGNDSSPDMPGMHCELNALMQRLSIAGTTSR